jgi:hypothetical protein
MSRRGQPPFLYFRPPPYLLARDVQYPYVEGWVRRETGKYGFIEGRRAAKFAAGGRHGKGLL